MSGRETIAFGEGKVVGLWCAIHSETDDKIEFRVINGLWDGVFDKKANAIHVNATGAVYPASALWRGRCPHRGYSEAISWIEGQIE